MVFSNEYLVTYLRVVRGCNLNCTHCFTLGNRDKVALLEMNNLELFLDSLMDNVAPQKGVFYLHGGETFLAPVSYLREVVNAVKARFDPDKFIFVPQTNLIYTLTDDIIDFVLNDCNGEIGISWDAGIRFGSIKTTKEVEQEALFFTNMRKLIAAGVSVNIAISAQRHLLKLDPVELVKKFDGAKTIDFELLTMFDEKTRDLKPNNVEWADWLNKLVDYYLVTDTSWALPQIDLYVKSFMERKIYDCKCNCCNRRTFTLNQDGTVGLCPDDAYINPLSNVTEMSADWKIFEDKGHEAILSKVVASSAPMCFSCEHYEVCGGNCEISLFDETDECPLGKRVLTKISDNISAFSKKYTGQAKNRIVELGIK